MAKTPKLLDVVALTDDLANHRLRRGQVGTVVEILDHDAYEIEFCDEDGLTYAILKVAGNQLMVLHHAPADAD